jgi:hypothetical protein
MSTITATLPFGKGFIGYPFAAATDAMDCLFSYSLTCTDTAICSAAPTVRLSLSSPPEETPISITLRLAEIPEQIEIRRRYPPLSVNLV